MKEVIREEWLSRIFHILSIILFLILFVISFCASWVNQWDLKEEYVYRLPDSLWQNLLGLSMVLLVFGFVYWLERRYTLRYRMDIVAGVVSVLVAAISIFWVEASNTVPQADQQAICMCAEEFEAGDFSRLEKGGYVGIYPQQLGLITFVRILFRIFGEGNFKVFQYFNALMAGLLVFSGYQIVKRLSEDNRLMELFYLMLMSVCVPLYCYVPFVYGEIASTALVMLGAWMLLSVCHKFSVPKVIVLSLVMGLAVQFRKNTLIFMVAFLIVAVIRLLRGVDRQRISIIVGMLLGVLVLQSCVDFCYRGLIPEDSKASPNIAYIAMGVNDDKGMAGWHNGYDVDIMKLTDYDVEAAKQASKEYLAQFWENCRTNPRYALDFYYRKLSMQWNAPMYQCLAMNNMFAEEPVGLAQSVYFGILRKIVEKQMNLYQLAVYGRSR